MGKTASRVTGRVVNVTDFGLFLDIFDGLEGLAHVSEIDVDGESLEEQYQLGDWVSARILRIEEEDKKVGLTIRGVDQPSDDEVAHLQAEWKATQAAIVTAADSAEDDESDAEEE